MAMVQSMLTDRPTTIDSSPTHVSHNRIQPAPASTLLQANDVIAHEILSVQQLESAASLYIKYCDCQPLPLFAIKHFQHSLSSCVPELIYAVIVLVSRFGDVGSTSTSTSTGTIVTNYLEPSRELTMQKVINGPVELSTIQTLCLLSLIEFNDGATARASLYSSLAWDLVLSAGLSSENFSSHTPQVLEERRRCYWSAVLLKNLFGNINGRTGSLINDLSPPYPRSADTPAGSSSNILEPGLPQPDGIIDTGSSFGVDHGIVASVIGLSDIWAKTVRYAHRRGKRQQPPSWAPESDYQQIMAQVMKHETLMPYKYRYKPARFDDYSGDEIQQHRTFWAPWYLNQMLYHSLLSLLNHPLILSLHLRNFRMTMVPEVFLQHTDDLTQTHTNWVIHLIDEANIKDFTPSDPYPAYCAAVVATIFLQQSYADNESVRSTKQENFNKCLEFIRASGKHWSRIARLVGCPILKTFQADCVQAEKVETFQRIVADSSQNAASTIEGKTYIDLSVFWEILESCFTSEQSALSEGYFDRSLTTYRTGVSSTDVVSGRLLPAPTRLDRNASTTSTPVVSATISQDQIPSALPGLPSTDDQFQVLAQSYFAQGADFVNLDDWWYPEQVLS